MSGISALSSCPDTRPFDLEKALLCTTYVQVPDLSLNPIQEKRLYKHQLALWLDDNGHSAESYRLRNCGLNFVHLKCSNGHEKYARMHCGQELCPTCGKKGSRLHKKRTVRALDRLMWASVLGYMVFTLPEKVSLGRPDLDTLKLLSKKAWEIVRSNFDTDGGLVRTHLTGERLGKLHIHMNVLFPITNRAGLGAVPKETLDRLRGEWTSFVNKQFKTTCSDTNVFYSFVTSKRKMRHKIKYVVRPVVDYFQFYTLSTEDRHYVLSLYNWHNSRWFGKLANCEYKKYLISKGINPHHHEEKDPHLSRVCPVCGERYRYIDIVYLSLIHI